ncbi:specifically androgen-regulated gene protein-like [Nematolebias whitei]|uniref:specifically androgen-regulated gene protein-like n=1 Tax=Nematolebias whitei TaxID=451745 RepID=UPI0018995486|nr:specifically androgen-regulated gene protein-like [Nematolebias whitei]
MLKSGTWPGNAAVEPSSNMDSSGSCDSVISVNSGCSNDSMEHLTPEERACLMFLEEIIEALEVQEDSGLSNDEPDSWTTTKDHIRVNGISSLASESGSQGMSPPPHFEAVDPAPMTSTPESETERHALNQNSEPRSTTAPSPPPFESAPACTAPLNLDQVPGLILNGTLDPDNVISSWSWSGEKTSEIDLSLLPPPSDFMDELDTCSQPKKLNGVPTEPELHVELVPLDSADSVNKISENSLTEDPPSSPPPDPASVSFITPPPEFSPPKSPPPVAPKPKKLPASIVLHSQKTAVGSPDGSVPSLLPTSGDWMLGDQQKVHMEALRKLGLLKINEEEAGLEKISTLPLKNRSRQSWAGPSPLSPGVSHALPLTPSCTHLSSTPPASASLQFVPSAAVLTVSPPTQDPDIVPAPAAFSDPSHPLPSVNELPTGADVPDADVRSPAAAPVKQLTSPKVTDMKSATLECSGVGVSSYLTGQPPTEADQRATGEQSQQHSSQPQPSSLGSRKDISCAKEEDLQAAPTTSKQTEPQRPLHAHNVVQHPRGESKPPRSQGISVLICPRPENVEERREALKKLGLLRD